MERDEVIKGLYYIKSWKCNSDAEMFEVIASAIKLLEQQVATSDLISRQAAIDALDCINGVEEVLRSLPPAQPERPKGEWIDLDSDTEKYDDIMCSNCKQSFTVDAYRWCDIGFTVDDLKFCPNCGADMRGKKDG